MLLWNVLYQTPSIEQLDPAHEEWCMDLKELNVWVYMSLLAVGEALNAKGAIIKDACWLRPIKSTQYIKIAELDAMLRGINLTLKWQVMVLQVNTDSFFVYHWMTNALTEKPQLNTKATSEMFMRWWLETLTSLVKEYNFSEDIALVKSDQNWADLLNGIPQKWFDMRKIEPMQTVCAFAVGDLSPVQLTEIHWYSRQIFQV